MKRKRVETSHLALFLALRTLSIGLGTAPDICTINLVGTVELEPISVNSTTAWRGSEHLITVPVSHRKCASIITAIYGYLRERLGYEPRRSGFATAPPMDTMNLTGIFFWPISRKSIKAWRESELLITMPESIFHS